MPIAEMKDIMPAIYTELHDTVKGLERHMKDMQVCSAFTRTPAHSMHSSFSGACLWEVLFISFISTPGSGNPLCVTHKSSHNAPQRPCKRPS